MIPPTIPADFSNLEPNRLPIFTPRMENRKVVTPMMSIDDQIFTWMQAKEMPTARASMLVAIANKSIVLKSKAPLCSWSSLPQTASRIMLAPIKKSNPKAIQWSTAVMYSSNCSPKKYPTKGIKAWNKPNQSPQVKAIFHENRLVVNPLQIETEKASIERPMPIKSISTKLIYKIFEVAKIKSFFNFAPTNQQINKST